MLRLGLAEPNQNVSGFWAWRMEPYLRRDIGLFDFCRCGFIDAAVKRQEVEIWIVEVTKGEGK